jgi:hypothetical protein
MARVAVRVVRENLHNTPTAKFKVSAESLMGTWGDGIMQSRTDQTEINQ